MFASIVLAFSCHQERLGIINEARLLAPLHAEVRRVRFGPVGMRRPQESRSYDARKTLHGVWQRPLRGFFGCCGRFLNALSTLSERNRLTDNGVALA